MNKTISAMSSKTIKTLIINHLNRAQIKYRKDFNGFMNQTNDVSGRLQKLSDEKIIVIMLRLHLSYSICIYYVIFNAFFREYLPEFSSRAARCNFLVQNVGKLQNKEVSVCDRKIPSFMMEY